MVIITQGPHEVQQMLAKDKTPILAGVIPVFEAFMGKWDILAGKRPWLKPFIKEGMYWIEKYYIRLDDTMAYAIALCEWHCSQIVPRKIILMFIS